MTSTAAGLPDASIAAPPPSITFCALASGSRGNALFISSGATAIIVDAGLSGREIQKRLSARNISSEGIGAIVVSHEHTDHLQGVGVLARRWKIPVYMSPETLAAGRRQLGRVDRVTTFHSGKPFSIGSLDVTPFATSHDAADPVGFTIGSRDIHIGIATDLGVATANVKMQLKRCALILLEANHDHRMLEQGPYPWPLKQRIRGRSGHLSNEDAARLLKEIHHENLRHVLLGHLSETNNTPEKALSAVGGVLEGTKTRLEAVCQDYCGPLLEIY
jgi:phosphoribosyl 1,2-cyclic phosphodiesterase